MSVIALAACGDNDDAVTTPVEPAPTPRLLTVEVSENPMNNEEACARVMNRTAAATTTATLSSFSMNYQQNKYDFAKTGDTWSTFGWPVSDNDTKIDFYAYNAGSFQWISGTPYVSFTMDENAFSQKDLLVATHKQISYNDAKGKVSLTFDHACAAVQFQICQTKKVTNEGKNFIINSVMLKNVCKNGDYYYDSGWTLGSDRTNYTLTNILENTLTSTLEKTSILTTDYQPLPCKWLFLIPQSQDGIQLEIKYTIDGGAEEKTKVLNVGTGNWEQGKQYTVNIRVGSSFLS